MKKDTDIVILANDIPDWNKCFNCVFVHKRRNRYICHLKWYIKKYVEKQKVRFIDLAFKVKTNDVCEHLITRPRFGTELYGNAVILYPFQKHGVKKFSFSDIFKLIYEPQLRNLQQRLGLKFLPKFNLGYSWTFSSSGRHALIRNQLINNGERKGKFTCNYCKKKFYYDEVEIHHIMERTNDGSDTTANLMILCLLCHDLETWKLVTGNTEITLELRWRKLIESHFKLWEKRKMSSQNYVKRLKDQVKFAENFSVGETTEVGINKIISNNRTEKKLNLVKIEKFLNRCNRKIAFWSKYEKKTSLWKYKKKSYGKSLPKTLTVDRFLKKS